MNALANCPAELELNDIVFSIYQVQGQWKVVHPTVVGKRVGRSKVVNVASRKAGAEYAAQYAANAV